MSDIDKYYVYDRTPTGNKSTSDTNNLPGARIIDRERLAATSTGHEQKRERISTSGALLAEEELMMTSTRAYSDVAAPLPSELACGARTTIAKRRSAAETWLELSMRAMNVKRPAGWTARCGRLLSWRAHLPVAMTTSGHGHEAEARRKRRERNGDPHPEATTAVRGGCESLRGETTVAQLCEAWSDDSTATAKR